MEKKEKELIDCLQKNINKKKKLVDEYFGILNKNQKEISVDLGDENGDKTCITTFKPVDNCVNAKRAARINDLFNNYMEKHKSDKDNNKFSVSLLDGMKNKQQFFLSSPTPIQTSAISFEFEGTCCAKYLPKPEEISDVNFSYDGDKFMLYFTVTPLYGCTYLNSFLKNNYVGNVCMKYTLCDGDEQKNYTTILSEKGFYVDSINTIDTINNNNTEAFKYSVCLTAKKDEE